MIKYLLLILILLSLILLINHERDSYIAKTVQTFKKMTPPVTLYYEEKTTFWYSVILKDSTGKLVRFGNLSIIANNIGDNVNVEDTIVLDPNYVSK